MPRSLAISAFWGNFFEHYDTALFGFLSPFLAPLIFPGQDPLTALILTYALIPMGMLARPLGSLVFGYIGDNYGRKKALILTFSGMSIVSFMIAFSPTYASAGLIAPLIFCLGRILQNFCSAGETVGGAIFLLENCSPKRQNFVSSLYSASTIGGILAASLSVSLLYYGNFLSLGWRLLYIVGGVMTLMVCFMRGMQDKTIFSKEKPTSYKLTEVVNSHKFKIFLIMISSGFSYANYCIALVLMNGLIPLITPHSPEKMMGINTALLALDFIALPFFGWLSDKVGREKLMLGSCLAIILTSLPLFMLLKGAGICTII
ncbi:MAG: MFS transporter, partial [Chlamydiota bacterium]